jgi:hypothetical protein
MLQVEVKCLGFDAFLKAAANAPEAIRRATARTLNETLTKSQSLMAKQAAAEYKITQRDIRASFRTHSANANDLNASVQSVGTKFPLFKFGISKLRQYGPFLGVRDPRAAVSIEEVRGQQTPLAHGFLAITKSGYAGIFERTGKSRYPIHQVVGLSAPQMIGARRSWPAIDAELHRYFASRIQANIHFFADLAG